MTRVLIVDSLPALRAHAAQIVKAALPGDVEIIEAADGRVAVEMAEEHLPDLIIIDIGVPVVNGIKAVARICATKPDTRVIFWTQYHREVYIRDVARILPAQATHGYVLKNHADDKLRHAIISVWLHDNPYLDPEVRATIKASAASQLTDREMEILQDLALGLTEKAISQRRNISIRGVQCRCASLYEKLLRVHDAGSPATNEVFNPRVRVVFEAVKRGLIEPDVWSSWDTELHSWLQTHSTP